MQNSATKFRKLATLDPSRFEAKPDGYFLPKELEEAGVRSIASLERDRWAGVGINYVKLGGKRGDPRRGKRVFYIGRDVLAYLQRGRVETQAA